MPPTYPTLPIMTDMDVGTSTGSTIACTNAAEFTAALTNAVGGDIITLAAGSNFVGPFTLPNKAGSSCITIRTSAADNALPAAGVRIDPSYAAVLPKILSPGTNSGALIAADGAHHYRFLGVELSTNSEGAAETCLILIGRGNMTDPDDMPHHIEFDRCYAHAYSTTSALRRVMWLNSATTTVKNCYFSDCKEVGADTQTILIVNGTGPFRITNNYLEAAGENFMVGGADPAITDLIPSDIEFTYNLCSKPMRWRAADPSYGGIAWAVKNLFELKMGARVLVEGNTFEYSWPHAQTGFAILLNIRNQDGGAPWAITEDVTFRNNLVRHATNGIQLLGSDTINASQDMQRVLIRNNLLVDIGWPDYNPEGQGINIIAIVPFDDLTVEHNTTFQCGFVFLMDEAPPTFLHLIWRDNIHFHNLYGVFGSGSTIGQQSLEDYAPGYLYLKNVMIANPYPQLYPAGQYEAADLAAVGFTNVTDLYGNGTDYSLTVGSPYHHAATDGTDVGIDWPALQAALSGESEDSAAPSNVIFCCVSSI